MDLISTTGHGVEIGLNDRCACVLLVNASLSADAHG